MSNPSNVPPWGCPWHGLVKGGAVQLPNGSTLAYPQPAGIDLGHHGDTALIAHPGAPEVVRTEDEQAADAAAGRQWWNKAILAARSVHGRSLGSGWIYIDPAGACWLVTTTLSWAQRNGGTADVTLRLFGVLGGAPEQYTYSVAVPDMGQAVPEVYGESYRVARYHSAPTGAAAAFEVAAQYNDATSAWWTWRPIGWLELTLAGIGAECAVAIELLHTRAQALGSITRAALPLTEENYYAQWTPDGTLQIVTTPTETSFSLLVSNNVIDGTDLYGFEGWVVGIYYDAAGVRHEVTLTERIETSYVAPALVHAGATSFPPGTPISGSFSGSTNLTSTLTMSYAVDGVEAASYVYELTQSSSQTLTLVDTASALNDYAGTVTCTPGSTFNASASAEAVALPRLMGGTLLGYMTGSAEPGDVPYWFNLGFAWCWEPNDSAGMWVHPNRYSNQLFGLAHVEQLDASGLRSVHRADVLHPGGVSALPELTLPYLSSAPQVAFGSWCPVTGQLARDSEPVCFT